MATKKDTKNQELVSEQEVWDVLDFVSGLYSDLKGYNGIPYDSRMENNNLIDLNNNPKVPSQERLRNAIINYKDNAELLQDYSEFMKAWDTLYSKIIENKLSLLSFDISWTVVADMIKDPSELSSKEFKEDYNRVCKFMRKFKASQEFRKATENMLIRDTYFCWLRDSYGTFNDDEIDIDYSVKKSQDFALQMMPQDYCKITGSSAYPSTFLWDFNLDYFENAWVNIDNYDPSLKQAYESIIGNKQIRNFVNSNKELNKISRSFDGYIRTKVSNGAYCFKYNTSNFNSVPPFASLMRETFSNDEIKKLQKSKDVLSANALILGEMKTKKDDKVGNEKNSFLIDPKQVGRLLQIAKNMINNTNIKQIALPLEETRLYQFNDMNPNMLDNRLSTVAKQSMTTSSMIYSNDKMGEFELKNSLALDYHSIADRVYPQFENFLEYFVNKKTRKYKFKFRVDGSTLQFLRDSKLNNQLKLSAMGIQADISKFASLMGYDSNELEGMMLMAKYGNMQDKLMLLMNTNTTSDGSQVTNLKDKAENSDATEQYD